MSQLQVGVSARCYACDTAWRRSYCDVIRAMTVLGFVLGVPHWWFGTGGAYIIYHMPCTIYYRL